MWIVRLHLRMWQSLFLLLFTHGRHLIITEGRISDACHGPSIFPQTHNKLECDKAARICIKEVRYYQWNPRGSPRCSWLISQPVPSRCCRHNVSRCSWVRTDERVEFQRICSGQSECDLQSLSQTDIAEPCLYLADRSTLSSVRSITYTCITSGNCSPTTTRTTSLTTTTRTASFPTTTKRTSETINTSPSKTAGWTDHSTTTKLPTTKSLEITSMSQNNSQVLNNTIDTGAIAGGVIGGVVACTLIVVLLVFLWKGRSTVNSSGPQTNSRLDGITDIKVVSRPDNITPRYSLHQPERDDKTMPWNRGAETNISAIYSEMNKTRTAANYDRVHGEAADFTMHGDYHHVTRHSYDGSSCDDVNGRVTGNAEVDMTYDQLHRGRAVPVKIQTEADPYDVLNRTNTRAT